MTGRPVGPLGLTILVIVAAAGLALAVLGWTHRGTEPVDQGSFGPIAVYVAAGAAR